MKKIITSITFIFFFLLCFSQHEVIERKRAINKEVGIRAPIRYIDKKNATYVNSVGIRTSKQIIVFGKKIKASSYVMKVKDRSLVLCNDASIQQYIIVNVKYRISISQQLTEDLREAFEQEIENYSNYYDTSYYEKFYATQYWFQKDYFTYIDTTHSVYQDTVLSNLTKVPGKIYRYYQLIKAKPDADLSKLTADEQRLVWQLDSVYRIYFSIPLLVDSTRYFYEVDYKDTNSKEVPFILYVGDDKLKEHCYFLINKRLYFIQVKKARIQRGNYYTRKNFSKDSLCAYLIDHLLTGSPYENYFFFIDEDDGVSVVRTW